MGPRQIFAVSLLSAGILHIGVLGLTRLGGHASLPPRLIAITLEATASAPQGAGSRLRAVPARPASQPRGEPAAAAPVSQAPAGYSPPAETVPPQAPADAPAAEAPSATAPVPVDPPAVAREEEASPGSARDATEAAASTVAVVSTVEPPSDAQEAGLSAAGAVARTGPGLPGGVQKGTSGGAPGSDGPGAGSAASGGGSGVTPGWLRGTIAPRYPLAAKLLGQEGTVRVAVRLDKAGAVLSVEILASSGHPVLDQAALEAVRKASFAPALERGRPVPSGLVIPIRFQLSGGKAPD